MNKTTVRGFGVGSRAIKFVTLSSLLVLTACAKFDPDDMAGPSQQELLAELEKNQLAWNNSGVAQYSLAVEKDCDCPDELKSKMKIFVDDVDDLDEEDELFDVLGTDPTATSRAKTGIASRERSDDNRTSNRNVQSAQSPRVETLFTDLRQAILQNAVQQVTYNPEYGFPQTVLVNNAANTQFAGISSTNRNRNSDSDDDNRNTFSPLTIQTSNFQVLGSRNGVRNGLNNSFNDDFNSVSLNGQFIRQNTSGVNAANQLFLVDDDGRWNQLSAPTNILNTLNTFPNQSRVSVTGQRFPGGINGQGYINLQQIVPNQSIRNDNNLRGVLNYSVLDNTSFDVDDFFVTNDSGRNVFINVPSNLRDQAFSLAGQRINLNGNWTPAFNAPNARFNPNGFNTVATVLESFNGILMPSTAAGVFQSNYVLVNDFGAMQELQVPAIFSNSFNSFVGKRVEIQGTRINTGAFGQPVILVQGLKEIQNIFTNSQQISGTVSTVYSGSGFGGVQAQTVLLQMDTGNSVTVQIPVNFTNPYNPITTGMRIQVTGAWISNSGFGQGQFEARAPVQITNLGYNAVATYSGFVSNIGSVGNGVNCNAAQNNYSFTSDTGQQFQLLVNNMTQIVGLNNQGFNLPYQARIQVSGTQLSPGVLQAQTITVSPQFETNISGTIVEIGSAGSTFTCAGQLNTYRLLDASGNAYSITTSASSIIQGGQGAYLRIGDQVLVTGVMSNTGTTFFASQIIATAATYPNAPYIPGPTPNTNLSTFVGTVTGLDCANNFADTYNFVDQFGTLYRLSVDMNLQASVYIDVGTQLQVTGSLVSNQITAQQVTQLLTFADPLNRIPMSGTIISMTGTEPSTCNTPVYTYQFQNDNGQIQRLRLTNEAAQHLPQPVANNTRITILSRIQSGNPQLIDALDIQYTNGQQFGVGGQPFFNGQPLAGQPLTGQPFTGQPFTGQPVNGTQPFTGVGIQTSVIGTVTATGCGNEYYFVDQSGIGYRLVLSGVPSSVFAGVGSKLNVTGQIVGNQLIASNVFTDQSQIYYPTPLQTSGTLGQLINTETLTCGVTISTYTFQNDNGRSQRLRVASSVATQSGQYLTTGSRVIVTNKLESFDGSTIDALNISQQGFF